MKNMKPKNINISKSFYIYFKSVTIIITYFFFSFAMSSDKNYDTSHLTPLEKYVTQEGGTEKPFDNKYWNNKKEGIYVDIVSGKPLFSSKDKYDSGTGWPSFTKPIEDNVVLENMDYSLGMKRVEIKSVESNSHLGHVFTDGPKEHGGNRYCMNSASLKFIAKEDLKKEGYAEYLILFDDEDNISLNYEKAIVAGGCFWGMESLFSDLEGVINVISGYTGGDLENPSYKIITTGKTGHAEAIEITFDPNIISYEKILKFFFKIHDPTTLNRQQNDVGTQYRSAIFYTNDKQKNIAQTIIDKGNASGVFKNPIVTTLNKLSTFYKAEDYHQNYLEKNPDGYTCHRLRKEWDF